MALEKTAEQQPRLRPDHDRAGFGKSLQAGGKVRCPAHDAALLSIARGDQVTDDDIPGANADAYLQRLRRMELPDGINETQAGSASSSCARG